MKKNKLISILKTFTKIELNQIRKYIASPYFNSNPTLLGLYDILERKVVRDHKKPLDREKIWKQLFDRPYSDMRYRKLFSELLKLVEGFLAQKVYESNPISKATDLITAVGEKGLAKMYYTTMKQARTFSEQQKYRAGEYYLRQFKIEKNYYELTKADLDRGSVTNVESIINNLDRFYLAEKMRYYCETLSRKSVISHEYELLFIDEIVQYLKQYAYDDVPPIAIYYQMYLTLTDVENEEHYFKLKELLSKYSHVFPIDEATDLYTNAINYCIGKANRGSLQFLEEFLIVNEELLSKGIIGKDGFSPWKFKNIVSAGVRLGKLEWTESFIHTYQDKLPDDFRENAVKFNLAQLYFYQKKYDEVISLLQEVEYEDFTYNLNSKTILLTTYYEIDDLEPLYFLMESFRVYLRRQKGLPQNRKEPYIELIKYTKQLTKLRKRDKESLDKLMAKVEETPGMASRKWFIEKIKEKY